MLSCLSKKAIDSPFFKFIEIRAVCRNKKAKSHNRLVLEKYKKRQCSQWQKGKYTPEANRNEE